MSEALPTRASQRGRAAGIEPSGPLSGSLLRRLRPWPPGRGTSLAVGLVVGGGAWLVLVVLAALEGIEPQVFSLTAIGGHVRLLVAIPLFFLCESELYARVNAFVASLVSSQVVHPDEVPALDRESRRAIGRWRGWPGELLCVVGATAVLWLAPFLGLAGATSFRNPGATGAMKLTGIWYFFVCLTLFRYLLLRCLWRVGVWCHFLWRLSRLRLNLVPTHPDRCGGLGFVNVVQVALNPLLAAVAAVQAAAFAEDVAHATRSLESLIPAVAMVLVAALALATLPLSVFTPRMITCRVDGLREYGVLAAHYVGQFDRKWLEGGNDGESILGTADLQSLADLGNSFSVVREMHWIPVGQRLLIHATIATLLPMAPLLLLKYPLAAIAEALLRQMVGM